MCPVRGWFCPLRLGRKVASVVESAKNSIFSRKCAKAAKKLSTYEDIDPNPNQVESQGQITA
jgi:hypothetical protein